MVFLLFNSIGLYSGPAYNLPDLIPLGNFTVPIISPDDASENVTIVGHTS